MERCARCDLIVGQGCACAVPGPDAPRRTAGAGGPVRWVRFAPDTILISSRRTAHLPGACDHMSESDVAPPAWGWVSGPEPGLWDRISAGNPVRAAEGNPRLVATSRCTTCLNSLA